MNRRGFFAAMVGLPALARPCASLEPLAAPAVAAVDVPVLSGLKAWIPQRPPGLLSGYSIARDVLPSPGLDAWASVAEFSEAELVEAANRLRERLVRAHLQ